MIVDVLTNAEKYFNVHPGFARAFKLIRELVKNPVEGKYDIEGDNIYAFVLSYTTSCPDDIKWETHNRYIDIQFLISGKEIIWWSNKNSLKLLTEYNVKEDYTLYEYDGNATTVLMRPLSFTVFFPDDAHIPPQMYLEPSENKKIIVKIRC